MRTTNRPVRHLALATALLAGLLAARHAQQRWGATAEEVAAELPGDAILGGADLVTTRAVTVAAPPQDVWPWLAQLGAERGGFYSYDGLQRLLGLGIRNADDVIPEWQDITPGDVVSLARGVGLTVAVAEPERALVLHGSPDPDAAEDAPIPFAFTWAFVLEPGPRRTTRLLVRERYRYLAPWAAPLVETVQVASFVMTARMLRGIKERAEYRPPAVPVG